MEQYIDYYVKTIDLLADRHAEEYVKKEALEQRKILTSKTGKSPDIMLLSPLAYEQIIKIITKEHGGIIKPTEFLGMKIQVIGDMEGLYIKEIYSDIEEEFLRGKIIRR
jgi:hypothetical protein